MANDDDHAVDAPDDGWRPPPAPECGDQDQTDAFVAVPKCLRKQHSASKPEATQSPELPFCSTKAETRRGKGRPGSALHPMSLNPMQGMWHLGFKGRGDERPHTHLAL